MDFIEECINSALESAATTGDDPTATGDDFKVCCVVRSGVGCDVSRLTSADPLDY